MKTSRHQFSDEMKKDLEAYHSISSLMRLLEALSVIERFGRLPSTMQGFMVRHRRVKNKAT